MINADKKISVNPFDQSTAKLRWNLFHVGWGKKDSIFVYVLISKMLNKTSSPFMLASFEMFPMSLN